MAVGRVVIVGAGPAGAALAYLLARRGVEVTLLERRRDFARTFRGDGLQPSGIDAFDQMGLGDRLRQLPQAIINTIALYQGGRRRARIATESLGFISENRPRPSFGRIVSRPGWQCGFSPCSRRAACSACCLASASGPCSMASCQSG